MAQVNQFEVVVGIQHVQVFYHFLIGDIALAEAVGLVEHRQGVSHSAVGFFGNHGQCFLFVGYSLLCCHFLQMVDDVSHSHSLKVVYLAA